ncbi:MAG TPA: SMC family ATPase [Actinomycetota bacterium]|nr:SMC family ATPase [Actinomycetota bacterium]
MRPVRLELKGFTSFRDDQAIDFEGLDLFAIAGPTGSGKSSILDAITYALYGSVDRVGRQVAQLVSQGQPRMAVMLQFGVGKERYRVARSTPAHGGSKILLERWEDGEWRQAGEGADRVREADAMIRQAVGLDYEAFTRSVLLPQGKFAEFLVGDAKDRRNILTELLGLELFERLARLAGEIKRMASADAGANERLLSTEYAGVTEEAVAEAAAVAAEAAAREASLAGAEGTLRNLADRWAETERSVQELRMCAVDARRAGAISAESAEALEDLAERLAEAEAAASAAAAATEARAKEARKARAAWEKARAGWGGTAQVASLRANAEALAGSRAEVAKVRAAAKEARAVIPKLAKRLEAAEQAVAARVGEAEAAIAAVESSEEALDRATHADLVAAVRSGVKVGDPCPVCGRAIESLPKARGAQALERVKAAHAKARRSAEQASEGLQRARADRDEAEREAGQAEREAIRIEEHLAGAMGELESAESEIAEAFGGGVPTDPVAVLDGRLGRLEDLDRSCEVAEAALAEAKDERVIAERERDGLIARAAEVRGRLGGLSVSGLVERARTLAGPDLGLKELPQAAPVTDTGELLAAATALAQELGSLAERLDELASARAEGEAVLLAEARGTVGDGFESAATLSELVDAVAGARTAAAREAATAEHRSAELMAKLANARELIERVTGQRERASRFDALSKELRADRIIAFLQVEALQILAAAGSEHLSTLSGGRYRLAFDQDEFFVIDAWNGEERRSARTLSGGETFLASLGLALALSEQVRSLSLTRRADLDSLFLDEGFGTLDPETLEVVVDAIEQLGSDGRMVGVITHVRELALRLPARIEVDGSPRGSQIQVIA